LNGGQNMMTIVLFNNESTLLNILICSNLTSPLNTP
jgi:hypothetical protein